MQGNGGNGGSVSSSASTGAGGGFGGRGGHGNTLGGAPSAGGGGGGLLGSGNNGGTSAPAGDGGDGGGGDSSPSGSAGGDGKNFGAGGAGAGNNNTNQSFGRGDGHFAGGGGGSNRLTSDTSLLVGGDGGFCGGGASHGGGCGGFAGGGGASSLGLVETNNAGFGGGEGFPNNPGDVDPAGGGAGMGAALFIHGGSTTGQGAQVLLIDPIFINNSASGGDAGIHNDETAGQGRSFGNDIYLMTGGNLTIRVTQGNTTTVPHPIDGNHGRGININCTHNNTKNLINTDLTDGLFEKTGKGTLAITGENTFTGTTKVSGGTLRLERGGEEFAQIMTPTTVENEAVLEVPEKAKIEFVLNPQGISTVVFPYNIVGLLPIVDLTQKNGSLVVVGDTSNPTTLVNETVLQVADGYTQKSNATLKVYLCSNRSDGSDDAFVQITNAGAEMLGNLCVEGMNDIGNFFAGREYAIVAGASAVDISNLIQDVTVTGDLANVLLFEIVDQSESGPNLLKIRVIEDVFFFNVPTNGETNCQRYIEYIRSIAPSISPSSEIGIFLENLGNGFSAQEVCDIILQNIPSVYSGLEWINLSSQQNIISAFNFIPECLYSLECDREKGQFWFRSTAWFEDYKTLQSMPGFRTRNAGFNFGYDYLVSSNWRFGALGNYTHNNIDFKKGLGKGDADSLQFGIYTNYCGNYIYFDGLVGGGINWYDVRRFVVIPEENAILSDATLLANFRGYPFLAHVKIGGNGYITDSLIVSPEIALSYHYLYTKQFKEKGANVIAWNMHSDNTNMLHTDIGAFLSKIVHHQYYRFIFFTGLSWILNCPLNNGEYTANLLNFSNVDFFSYNKCRNYIAPKLGIKVISLTNCTTLELQYIGKFGSGRKHHAISAGLQAKF